MVAFTSTAGVAAASGYSAQQVRDLEALGVIAAAARLPNGHRRFSATHVSQLRAYRDVAYAVGPVEARRTMQQIRRRSTEEAAALVGGLHAQLGLEREQALSARSALHSIRDEAATDAEPVEGDTMTITELSQALGVRPSALRFWERAGLVAPERVATPAGHARRYAVAAVREARITAALRAGGYRIPEVQRAIAAVRDLGEVSDPLAALDARLASISSRSLALLRAGALLADVIESTSPAVHVGGLPRVT